MTKKGTSKDLQIDAVRVTSPKIYREELNWKKIIRLE